MLIAKDQIDYFKRSSRAVKKAKIVSVFFWAGNDCIKGKKGV